VPSVLDRAIVDEVVQIANEDAFATAKRLAKLEGLPAGISTGGNVWAALEVAKRPEMAGKTIVTVACSSAERYFSSDLFA